MRGVRRFPHNNVACQKPCTRPLPCGHGCSQVCSDKCRCGKGCNRFPEAPKRSKVKVATLEEFLGEEDEPDDDVLPPSTAKDIAADLISMCGDDEVVTPDYTEITQASIRDGTPACMNCRGASQGSSEGSEHMPEDGIKASMYKDDSPDAKPKSDFNNSSPSTGSCFSNCISGIPSLIDSPIIEPAVQPGQSWSNWDPIVADLAMQHEAKLSNRVRAAEQVIHERFEEVLVLDGCQRQKVKVHEKTTVETRRPEEQVQNTGPPESPEMAGSTGATVASPPAAMLINISDVPAVPNNLEKEKLLAPLVAEDGIKPLVLDEDVRSDVSDLISF